jgi:hypothetical protein
VNSTRLERLGAVLLAVAALWAAAPAGAADGFTPVAYTQQTLPTNNMV